MYKESETTDPGNELIVKETPFGKLGLSVCYDIRFPELFRCLFNKGAEIIVIPSAFTVKTGEAHWELLARTRAVENFCFIDFVKINCCICYSFTDAVHFRNSVTPWANDH